MEFGLGEYDHERGLAENNRRYRKSAEQPVAGSVIADVIFGSRQIVKDITARFQRDKTTFHIELGDADGAPLIVLKNEEGVELSFRLDLLSKQLIGDWDDYLLTDVQIKALVDLSK